jgi:hypothetical protein
VVVRSININRVASALCSIAPEIRSMEVRNAWSSSLHHPPHKKRQIQHSSNLDFPLSPVKIENERGHLFADVRRGRTSSAPGNGTKILYHVRPKHRSRGKKGII